MDHSGRLFKLINIFVAAGLLFLAAPWWPPAAAQGPLPASKISSRLDIQLKEKSRLAARSPGQAQAVSPRLARKPIEEITRQKIFLRMKQFPTLARVAELRALGVTLYPNSWIPPVGKHTTGFMYAEAPVGRIQDLAAKDYVASLQSAETQAKAKNDVAAAAMNVNSVWVSGYTGAGVKVAVLDSGLDVTHPDIPATLEKKDYSAYPVLSPPGSSDNVANTVTGHGTHVTGSAVGRGTQSSSGLYNYKGTAPGANLVFLKIGRSSDSAATSAAMIGAIKDAVDVYNARVITMSYGSFSSHHDGTGEVSQAVDYAAGKGAVFFGAAGNEAAAGLHYSDTVNPGKTNFIKVNVSGAGSNTAYLAFNLVWFDGPGVRNDLSLEYYSSNNDASRILTINSIFSPESTKGTESQFSKNNNPLPGGNSAWYLKVNNPSTTPQFFHIYYDDQWNTGPGSVKFENPDQSYTINEPAEADGAIAVGAYVSRASWTDYQGNFTGSGLTTGSIGYFSSRGPRVDAGAPGKPNLVAPGSVVISLRDKDTYPWPTFRTDVFPYPYQGLIIDNDGLNLNGSGPADYYVSQGTSMATPLAAGVGALLLSKNPGLTPAQVRNFLETTATDKGGAGWDLISGWGLINAQAALNAVPPPLAVSFTKSLNPANGLAPCVVTFTDTSTGAPTSWSWNFGDGTGSSSQNPTRTYNTPGNYTVTLTATNALGSNSTSQVIGIYALPAASFNKSLNPASGVAPVTANFSDTSTGNIVSRLWNFGDGAASSTQNPSKVYNTAGNYTVGLTVTNPVGSNSVSQTVRVYSTLTAGFTRTLVPASGAVPLTVNFTDTSTGNPATWSWSFGDGATSSSQHPAKVYNNAGTYTVTLTVTNPTGSSSTSQTVTAFATPGASFTASAFTGNVPLTVNLTDTSIGNVTGWFWNFGDGTVSSSQNPSKTFYAAGNFAVTLTASNAVGSNSASATIQVYSAPTAAFSASVVTNSPGSPISFTDLSEGNITGWSWNFGDGTTSGTKNPSKSYTTEAPYTVTLTVTNPVGSNTLSRPSYITIVAFKSETEISQGVNNGYVYVAGRIKRFFNSSTSGTVTLADGIGAYDAYIDYASSAVSVKAASVAAPFSSPTFALDALGGVRSTVAASQTGATPQAPLELFKFYPWLTGSKDNFTTVTLHFNSITRSAGGQAPQSADATRGFRRGDADNNGAVTIVDALFVAQYLAGLRTLGEGPGQVWPVNAATPRNDSITEGASLNIVDALYIAQMLAGLRDASYNSI